ncbi:MAG: YkgJ family cysteine cluster protein [Candidatus Freyarchaeota archaeon]|nr:YkgJ family cysteine cluster protein [Candidatus Jordarchaeia archaeon]MBS7269083.1 YkgJ family cysteine cluster protein [Candidatus Jordarchaeia archaeon]MBS7280704.1 YkgJ family cysteine cluster protein [Candidatus Jordarchaeia archaeon]
MKCSRCGLCCHNTEMLLSSGDIARLEALGYNREDFMVTTVEGFHQLRNINGKCFFYNGGCSVYSSRPEGCSYYPIVLNFDRKSCLVDKECPNHHTVTKREIREKCKKLKALYREILKEVLNGHFQKYQKSVV